jgi:hypothetical protein
MKVIGRRIRSNRYKTNDLREIRIIDDAFMDEIILCRHHGKDERNGRLRNAKVPHCEGRHLSSWALRIEFHEKLLRMDVKSKLSSKSRMMSRIHNGLKLIGLKTHGYKKELKKTPRGCNRKIWV